MPGENQCHVKVWMWCAWNIAKNAKSTNNANSIQDITTCTVTVMVTPAATAQTIERKNTHPTKVTSILLLAAAAEKRPSTLAPAGTVAMTMKINADTINAQPDMNPSRGCSARRTHE